MLRYRCLAEVGVQHWYYCVFSGNKFHSSRSCSLNRIFFEQCECLVDESGTKRAILINEDVRAVHIINTLKLRPGDNIRVGILDGGVIDTARILSIDSSKGVAISFGDASDIVVPRRPCVDLVIAYPRPKRIRALLSTISSLGVGRIFLVPPRKIEKGYLGSHYYQRPDLLRGAMVEGLSQASVDCWVPAVHSFARMDDFFTSLPKLFPVHDTLRLLAHPLKVQPVRGIEYVPGAQGQETTGPDRVCGGLTEAANTPSRRSLTLSDMTPPPGWADRRVGDREEATGSTYIPPRVVVAVGPEGGWTDEELAAFTSDANTFIEVNIGDRVLRSETAVSALLCRIHEWVGFHTSGDSNIECE